MELFKLLPDYYEQNVSMKTLQELLSVQTNELETGLTETVDQCFAGSVSTQLSRWERFLGLNIDITKSTAFRRERIAAKISGAGTTTKEMIKDVASRYSNGEVEVYEDNEHSRFTIKFVGTIGIHGNMADLMTTIEEIKPAHLAVEYEYVYNTHGKLSGFTHEQLSAYTHSQLRNEGIENVNENNKL